MLILGRKIGQTIIVNGNIRITVTKIEKNQVKIGIEAPREVPIFREEISPSNQLSQMED